MRKTVNNRKSKSSFLLLRLKLFYVPFRFRKAGKVWSGGARETHWATSHNGVTSSKTEEFFQSLCFLDPNGRTVSFPVVQNKGLKLTVKVCKTVFLHFSASKSQDIEVFSRVSILSLTKNFYPIFISRQLCWEFFALWIENNSITALGLNIFLEFL